MKTIYDLDLNPPGTILVPVDFSTASHAALVLAGQLARYCGASLHVLYVENTLLETAAEQAGIDAAAASRVELRRLIRDAWPASACPFRLHTVAGSPVNVILDVANQEGVDLIVMPSSQQSAIERLTITSTTERLLRRANVSVLVAPPLWMTADSSLAHPTAASAGATRDATLDSILGTSVQIVRGGKGSAVAPIAYRALSAATIPILLQFVEGLLE